MLSRVTYRDLIVECRDRGEPIHKVATRGIKLSREFDKTIFAWLLCYVGRSVVESDSKLEREEGKGGEKREEKEEGKETVALFIYLFNL